MPVYQQSRVKLHQDQGPRRAVAVSLALFYLRRRNLQRINLQPHHYRRQHCILRCHLHHVPRQRLKKQRLLQ